MESYNKVTSTIGIGDYFEDLVFKMIDPIDLPMIYKPNRLLNVNSSYYYSLF
jgi:hypothetical protein